MNNMALFDILALCIILACIFMSMTRGVIAEVASMLAWVVSFVVARMLAEPFADIAFHSVEPHALAIIMSFIALFFIAWFVQRFLRSLMTSIVSAMGLGGINRMLGGMFGAVKGVIIIMLGTMMASVTDLPQTDGWKHSISAPYFETLAQIVLPHLQDVLQHHNKQDTDMLETDSENMQI